MTTETKTTTERRFLYSREIRMGEPGDNTPGVIEGYAAVFYREGDAATEFDLWPGELVERIDRQAFADIANDDVRCLFNHESSAILGRSISQTLELAIDDVGLLYRCTLPNTSGGRDVAESIRRGDVSGSSFQFEAVEQEWIERENLPTVRLLKKLRTFDVGPVTFPAYEGTTTGVRGRDLAKQELERIHRYRRIHDRKIAQRRLIQKRAQRNAQR